MSDVRLKVPGRAVDDFSVSLLFEEVLKMLRLLLPSALAFQLLACAAIYEPWWNATPDPDSVQVYHDEFSGVTTYTSATSSRRGMPGYEGFVSCTRKTGESDRDCQLRVTSKHNEPWHDYASAVQKDGSEFVPSAVSKDVFCRTSRRGSICTYAETVGVDLTSRQLEVLAQTGIDMEIRGEGGSVDVGMSSEAIQALLVQLDRGDLDR